MPFIVTTKLPCETVGQAGPGQTLIAERTISRRVVATVSDVHDAIGDLLSEYGAGEVKVWPDLMMINEAGGTLPPMGDGTTVEVEMSTWEWLAADAGLGRTVLGHMAACGDTEAQEKILAAHSAAGGLPHAS